MMRSTVARFPATGSAAILVLFACLALSSPAHSQSDSLQGGPLHITSRLVTLDVSVVDGKGDLVSDLTRSDFTIFENGEVQTISSFEPYSDHRLGPTFTTNSINGAADLERVAPNAPVTVLVLDEFNTDFGDTAYARLQIRRYLTAQPPVLRQPTLFLAATDAGFQQVQDYTLDRQRLLDALAHLPPVLPGGLMRTGHSREGMALRFGQTLDSLQQIAKATLGHPGRKNIIWVGRGFDSLDLRNETDRTSEAVQSAAERAVNLLRQAHATVYTVDPTLSTKRAGDLNENTTDSDAAAFVAETHDPKDPFKDTVSFNTIAPLTGGRSFAMFNDLDQEIATSVTEGSSYYAMAYVPSASVDTANPYRRIDVRVDRPGLKVITRHGYYTVTPPLPAATPQRALKSEGYDIGSAISSGITFTGLHITALLSPVNPSECIVQVATQDIQWQPEPDGTVSAHLALVAVAMDQHGKPLADSAKDVVARLKSMDNLDHVPFTTLRIALPAARSPHSIRLAVRDAYTGKLGTAEVRLAVAK